MSDKKNMEKKTVSKTTVSTGVVVATSVALLSVSALMAVGVATLNNNLAEELNSDSQQVDATSPAIGFNQVEVDAQVEEFTNVWDAWVNENLENMYVNGAVQVDVSSYTATDSFWTWKNKVSAVMLKDYEQSVMSMSGYGEGSTRNFSEPNTNQLTQQDVVTTILYNELPVYYQDETLRDENNALLSDSIAVQTAGNVYTREGNFLAEYVPQERSVLYAVQNADTRVNLRAAAMRGVLNNRGSGYLSDIWIGQSYSLLQVETRGEVVAEMLTMLSNNETIASGIPADEIGTVVIRFNGSTNEPESLEYFSDTTTVKMSLLAAGYDTDGNPIKPTPAAFDEISVAPLDLWIATDSDAGDTTWLRNEYALTRAGKINVKEGGVTLESADQVDGVNNIFEDSLHSFVSSNGDAYNPEAVGLPSGESRFSAFTFPDWVINQEAKSSFSLLTSVENLPDDTFSGDYEFVTEDGELVAEEANPAIYVFDDDSTYTVPPNAGFDFFTRALYPQDALGE